MNNPELESEAPPEEQHASGRLESSIRRNTVVLSLSKFLGLAIGLVVTPIVYATLGQSLYGLFAALGSWGATIGAFDFGLSASFLRYITTYIAKNEKKLAGATASLAILFFVCLGLVVLLASSLLAPSINHLIKIEPHYRQHINPCLIMACCFIAFNGVCSIPGQILTARHRLDLVAWISLICQVIGGALSVILVTHGFGIYGLFISMYAQQLLYALATQAMVFKLYGWTYSNPFQLTKSHVKEILQYGGWAQLSAVTGIVQSQSDKIVIGGLASTSSVAPYDFGNKIALLSRTFPLSICAAAFPAIASIAATDSKKLSQAYARSTNMLALATVIIASFIIASGEYLLRAWIGGPVPYATAIMVLLVISYSSNNLTGIGTAYFRALGKPYYETGYGWISLVVNVALTIVLGLRYGLMGVVTGTLFGWTSGSIFFIVLFHRITKIGWWDSVGRTLAKICAVGAACGALAWSLLAIFPITLYEHRLIGLTIIGSVFAIYLSLYLLASAYLLPECLDGLGRIGHLALKIRRRFSRNP